MDNLSRHFLIATPTKETISWFEQRVAQAPVLVNVIPVFFMSPPNDRDSFQLGFNEGTDFEFKITGHGFVFNPNINRTQFSLFVAPVLETLLSDAGADVLGFRPYGALVNDPMRTSNIRFWLKNFGDALVGQSIWLELSMSESEILPDLYNPTLEVDHPFSYSDAL